MILEDVKYAKCVCGISYPLASLAKKGNANDPDRYIPHANRTCRNCMVETRQWTRK